MGYRVRVSQNNQTSKRLRVALELLSRRVCAAMGAVPWLWPDPSTHWGLYRIGVLSSFEQRMDRKTGYLPLMVCQAE